MPWYLTVLIIIAGLALLALAALWLISLVMFLMMCSRRATKRGIKRSGNYSGAPGKGGFRGYIHECEKRESDRPCEWLAVTAPDGTELRARFYPAEGDKIFIGCHGLASRGLLEYAQTLPFWLGMGFSVLLPDMRAHGESGGDKMGYGVLDRDDILLWVKYVNTRFGGKCRIILAGSSMGGCAVMNLADEPELENVRGIISDCGMPNLYSVCTDSLKRLYRLPAHPTADFIRLHFRLFLGYDIKGRSALDSLSRSSLPVLLLHGTKDSYVNYAFALQEQAVDPARIKLVSFEGADHTESHYKDSKKYEDALRAFADEILKED